MWPEFESPEKVFWYKIWFSRVFWLSFLLEMILKKSSMIFLVEPKAKLEINYETFLKSLRGEKNCQKILETQIWCQRNFFGDKNPGHNEEWYFFSWQARFRALWRERLMRSLIDNWQNFTLNLVFFEKFDMKLSGLVVSIPDCQAADPGSIPPGGRFFLTLFELDESIGLSKMYFLYWFVDSCLATPWLANWEVPGSNPRQVKSF